MSETNSRTVIGKVGDPVPPMFWFRDQDGNSLLIVETPDEQ
jgi:hypothetical protein